MIAVKTKMRDMPQECIHCLFYRPSRMNYFEAPSCGAKPGFSHGKPIGKTVQPTLERPKWCPLRVMQEATP